MTSTYVISTTQHTQLMVAAMATPCRGMQVKSARKTKWQFALAHDRGLAWKRTDHCAAPQDDGLDCCRHDLHYFVFLDSRILALFRAVPPSVCACPGSAAALRSHCLTAWSFLDCGLRWLWEGTTMESSRRADYSKRVCRRKLSLLCD